MTKDEVLRELYSIIKEISVFALKPYDKFYAENSNKSEEELHKALCVAHKMKSMKK